MYNLGELKRLLGDNYVFKQSKTVDEVRRILETGEIDDTNTVPFVLEAGNLDIEVNICFENDDPPFLDYYCCARTTHMNGDWESYDNILEDVNLDVPDLEAEMFRVLVEFADKKGLNFFALNENRDFRGSAHKNIMAENYHKLCELAPAFMKGDEDYAAFTSPRDITRLIELQRIENDPHIELSQVLQSGGHRAITDISMSLLPERAEGLLHPVNLYREGWSREQSAVSEDGIVDHAEENRLSEFLSGWLDNIRQYEFTQMPLPESTEDHGLTQYSY